MQTFADILPEPVIFHRTSTAFCRNCLKKFNPRYLQEVSKFGGHVQKIKRNKVEFCKNWMEKGRLIGGMQNDALSPSSRIFRIKHFRLPSPRATNVGHWRRIYAGRRRLGRSALSFRRSDYSFSHWLSGFFFLSDDSAVC